VHPTTTSTREKIALRERLRDEGYTYRLNQPPIQSPLRPDSSIRNDYNNKIEVGMDDYLWDMNSKEEMFSDA